MHPWVLALVTAMITPLGCVTVNVNFPEGAVQKAADDYVRELYRTKTRSESKDQTQFTRPLGKWALWSLLASELASDTAQAANVQAFHLQSAKAKALKTQLASRVRKLIQFKRKGFLGETRDGRVEVHSTPQNSPRPGLRVLLQKLVKAENQDRMALYQEALQSNQMEEAKLEQVRSSFARAFQAESPSGTWLQNADGSWTQKK